MYTNEVKVETTNFETEIDEIVKGTVKLSFTHPIINTLTVELIEHWFARKKIRVNAADYQDFIDTFCELVEMTCYLASLDRYTHSAWNVELDKIEVCKLAQIFFTYIDVTFNSASDELPNIMYKVKISNKRKWNVAYYVNIQNKFLSYFREDIYKECSTAAACRKVANLADVWDKLAIMKEDNKVAICKYKGGNAYIPVLVNSAPVNALDARYLYKTNVTEVLRLYVVQNH